MRVEAGSGVQQGICCGNTWPRSRSWPMDSCAVKGTSRWEGEALAEPWAASGSAGTSPSHLHANSSRQQPNNPPWVAATNLLAVSYRIGSIRQARTRRKRHNSIPTICLSNVTTRSSVPDENRFLTGVQRLGCYPFSWIADCHTMWPDFGGVRPWRMFAGYGQVCPSDLDCHSRQAAAKACRLPTPAYKRGMCRIRPACATPEGSSRGCFRLDARLSTT